MGMGTCYFSLAVQIPIVSLLGTSPKHGSQTALPWSSFPESTSESTVPKLGGQRTLAGINMMSFCHGGISQEK